MCPTGPLKAVQCLAFFGVKYQNYLWIILISLLIGFSLYFFYLRIRAIELETKIFLIKGLLISLIFSLLLSVVVIWFQGQIIY